MDRMNSLVRAVSNWMAVPSSINRSDSLYFESSDIALDKVGRDIQKAVLSCLPKKKQKYCIRTVVLTLSEKITEHAIDYITKNDVSPVCIGINIGGDALLMWNDKNGLIIEGVSTERSIYSSFSTAAMWVPHKKDHPEQLVDDIDIEDMRVRN